MFTGVKTNGLGARRITGKDEDAQGDDDLRAGVRDWTATP
jgi:hypothetical protein